MSTVASISEELLSFDFLWLEITKKCNLLCAHCYVAASPCSPLIGKLKCRDWLVILEDAFRLGCKSVQFIGGEPILHPDLLILINHAKKTGYSFVEVFTNGTVANDRFLSLFARHEVNLAFSLYASEENIHDKITKRPESFAKTVKAIQNALDKGIPVRVGVVAMSDNADVIDQTVNFLNQLGVEKVKVDHARGIGRGKNLSPNSDLTKELCGSCWQGKLCVNSDGQVSPCIFSSFYSLGDVSQGLEPILKGRRLRDFRSKMKQELDSRYQNCVPSICHPHVCVPQTRPCSPECAPSCSPCVPDLR